MCKLYLDLETYCDEDITKVGSYRYIDDPSFEVLLLAYAFDDGPVEVVDLTAKERIPQAVYDALMDERAPKVAYNAAFERVALHKWLDAPLTPDCWEDTMIRASYAGLPRSLEEAGAALGLGQDKAKLKIGKDLIRKFCRPCRPTRANGGSTRVHPQDEPGLWLEFKAYNKRDVEAEREIERRLKDIYMPDTEWTAWREDQRINDRGVRIDMTLACNAVDMAEAEKKRLTAEAVALTGMDNPNSVAQLKEYLGLAEGATLRKDDVKELLTTGLPEDQQRLLEIRQELGKSSVSKYEAMIRSVCRDGRVHGTMQYYKAARTGRWAGSLIQPQNFPQNHLEDLDLARRLVRENDMQALPLLIGPVTDTLSQLIRTAIVPAPGKRFCVADFSAIEARVIAWLAGEKWRMQAFADGKDIYCASATAMFHVPVVKHGVNGELRQKGKIAELACGYGGGVGAMISMGALNMGLKESELQGIVNDWRDASPQIVRLWRRTEQAAREALDYPGSYFPVRRGVGFRLKKGRLLEMSLPSGRKLYYQQAKITKNKFGNDSIGYMGNDAGKWSRLETFGGKLVENCVQAIARDCLRDMLLRLRDLDIVFHVHDEMIAEADAEEAPLALKTMLDAMAAPINWAPGLLLKGDGFICDYYQKD